MGIKIEGIAELDRAFAELDSKMQRVGLIKAVKPGGELIKADMELHAPFDPESRHKKHLRESITTKFVKRGTRKASLAIGPDKDVAWRAKFSEFGTAHEIARPWMLPALEAQSEAAERLAGEALWDVIKSVAK